MDVKDEENVSTYEVLKQSFGISGLKGISVKGEVATILLQSQINPTLLICSLSFVFFEELS